MVTVILDPGHGGSDPGAIFDKLIEKIMNLITANKTKSVLEAHGVRVLMTRTTDIYLSLSKRAQIANAAKADYFVSIHYNAGKGIGAEAIHSIAYGKSEELAKALVNSIAKVTGQKLRPRPTFIKKGADGLDYYGVIRETKMPAVIVEPGFIDSEDRIMFNTVAKQEAQGVAIAYGILNFLKIPIKDKEAPKPVVTNPTPDKETVPKPVAPATTTTSIGTVVNASTLNVRATPSSNGKILTVVKKGHVFDYLGVEQGWAKVAVDKKIAASGVAYVGPSYLKISTKVTSKTATVVNCSVLNVRQASDAKAKVLTTVKVGHKFTYLGEENGWAKVAVDKKIAASGVAYVGKNYVSVK